MGTAGSPKLAGTLFALVAAAELGDALSNGAEMESPTAECGSLEGVVVERFVAVGGLLRWRWATISLAFRFALNAMYMQLPIAVTRESTIKAAAIIATFT